MDSVDFTNFKSDFEDQELFLKFLAKKYTFRILRELRINESKRFNYLVSCLDNVSTKTLSNRLKELVRFGLVSREQFNEIPPRVEYSLTKKGANFIEKIDYLMQLKNDLKIT